LRIAHSSGLTAPEGGRDPAPDSQHLPMGNRPQALADLVDARSADGDRRPDMITSRISDALEVAERRFSWAIRGIFSGSRLCAGGLQKPAVGRAHRGHETARGRDSGRDGWGTGEFASRPANPPSRRDFSSCTVGTYWSHRWDRRRLDQIHHRRGMRIRKFSAVLAETSDYRRRARTKRAASASSEAMLFLRSTLARSPVEAPWYRSPDRHRARSPGWFASGVAACFVKPAGRYVSARELV